MSTSGTPRFDRRWLLLLSALVIALVAGSLVWQRMQDWEVSNLQKTAQKAYRREQFGKAIAALQRAIETEKRLFGEDTPRYRELLKRIGWVYASNQEYAKSRKVMEAYYKLSPEELRRVRFASTMLADEKLARLIRQRPVEAIEILSRGIVNLERYLGEHNPTNLPLLDSLSVASYFVNDYLKAAECVQQQIRIVEFTEGKESAGAARYYSRLGQLADCFSKYKENVAPHYSRAIEIYKSLGGFEKEISAVEELKTGKGSNFFKEADSKRKLDDTTVIPSL
jgi:tetratricopeptide (TPR) repeat protein